MGQLVLVGHNVSSIDHGFSEEIVLSQHDHDHHHDHNDEENNKKHECPECLLSQSLQVAFYNSTDILPIVVQAEELIRTEKSFTIAVIHYNANSPRAPPANLI